MHFERKEHFITGQPVWVAIGEEEDGLDVLLGGDDQRPDPARVAQAAWAVEHVEALFAAAKAHLEAFADMRRLGPGRWRLEALELGRRADDRPDELEVALYHDGDDAQWSVIMRVSPQAVGGFFPIELRRRYV